MGKAVRSNPARGVGKSSFMPPKLADSLKRRSLQFDGLSLLVAATALLLALLSFDPNDPSINRSAAGGARNWMGTAGAHVADATRLDQIGVDKGLSVDLRDLCATLEQPTRRHPSPDGVVSDVDR